MTADALGRMIDAELDGKVEVSNLYGIDLPRCRVRPTPIKVIAPVMLNGRADSKIMDAWLVLESDPIRRDGYKIIFDETSGLFGLATGLSSDACPVLCGLYGDFLTTLAAM